jgi:hypothetical protein
MGNQNPSRPSSRPLQCSVCDQWFDDVNIHYEHEFKCLKREVFGRDQHADVVQAPKSYLTCIVCHTKFHNADVHEIHEYKCLKDDFIKKKNRT